MRSIVIAAGLTACLGLAACEQSKSQATETPAPAARKSLSRPAQLYMGQAQILKVDAATVAVAKSGGLTLSATGQAATPGYYNLAFVPRINAAPPVDGIYEVDVVGYVPQSPVAQTPAPVEVKGDWTRAPVERVKGVRFIAKTNEVVAMLPQG